VARKRKAKRPRKPRAPRPAVFFRAGKFESWTLSWGTNVNAPLTFPTLPAAYLLKSVCITFTPAGAGWNGEVRLIVADGAGNQSAVFSSTAFLQTAGATSFAVTLADVPFFTVQNLTNDEVMCGSLPSVLPILPTMNWSLSLLNDPALSGVGVVSVNAMLEYLPIDVPALPVTP